MIGQLNINKIQDWTEKMVKEDHEFNKIGFNLIHYFVCMNF